MAVSKLTFYRGNKKFIKKFALMQDGAAYNLNNLTNPVVIWHFLNKKNNTKKSITWNEVLYTSNTVGFLIPDDFWTQALNYESQIEVYDDTGLLIHSEEIFIVEIKDPVGVHTDA